MSSDTLVTCSIPPLVVKGSPRERGPAWICLQILSSLDNNPVPFAIICSEGGTQFPPLPTRRAVVFLAAQRRSCYILQNSRPSLCYALFCPRLLCLLGQYLILQGYNLNLAVTKLQYDRVMV